MCSCLSTTVRQEEQGGAVVYGSRRYITGHDQNYHQHGQFYKDLLFHL